MYLSTKLFVYRLIDLIIDYRGSDQKLLLNAIAQGMEKSMQTHTRRGVSRISISTL